MIDHLTKGLGHSPNKTPSILMMMMMMMVIRDGGDAGVVVLPLPPTSLSLGLRREANWQKNSCPPPTPPA